MDGIWGQLASERFSWAHRARGRYIDQLPDAARMAARHASSGRPVVVVYGISQVGKTGLILRLMGIAPEEYETVDRVLRAGRRRGKSATVTAQVYDISEDDVWRVNDPQTGVHELLDAEDCRLCLMKLRDTVHAGIRSSFEAVRVSIPSRHFIVMEEGRKPVIVDLPGVKSSETREFAHVEPLVERWLSIASCVILVAKAEHLAGIARLLAERSRGLCLEDKQLELVLTFSYSAETTKRALPDFQSRQDVLTHIREQMEKSEVPDIISSFYPVEFGESLRTLRTRDPSAYKKVAPWLEDFFDDLRRVATRRSSPIDALMNVGRGAKHLKQQMERHQREFDESIAEHRRSCLKESDRLGKRLNGAIHRRQRISDLDATAQHITELISQLESQQHAWPDRYFQRGVGNRCPEGAASRNELAKWLELEKERLLAQTKRAMFNAPEPIELPSPGDILGPVPEKLLASKKELARRYLFNKEKKLRKQRGRCKSTVDDLFDSVKAKLIGKAIESLRGQLLQVQGALGEAKRDLMASMERCLRSGSLALTTARQTMPDLIATHREKLEELDKARAHLEKPGLFWHFCWKEFQMEFRRLTGETTDPAVVVERRMVSLLGAMLAVTTVEQLGAWEG